jgi:outer membrane protein OmpA-like peptidoglycan-associated protein
MTKKGVLVAAILALPIGARAEPSTASDPDPATQFANILTTSSDSANKPARAPKLTEVTAAKPTLPTGPTSDAPRLGEGQRVAAPPTLDNTPSRVEPHSSRSAFHAAPVGAGGASRAASIGHPHRVKIVSFEPGVLRAGSGTGKQVDELVRSWKSNLKWHAITVDGYVTNAGSDAEPAKAGQRAADEVRAYLVRRGIPPDLVTAIGHAAGNPATPAAKIEITVTTCDDVTIACRRPATSK